MITVQNYSPILTETTRNTFLRYISALNIPEIDYLAIGIQNSVTQQSISLMSNLEWQNKFHSNQYAKYDPIRRAALGTKRNIIPFNDIDFSDNFGKEIMRQRKLTGIKNGILLMQRFSNYNYMITLGTGFSLFDPFTFITRYHNKIGSLKSDCIQLVEKDALEFLSKTLGSAFINEQRSAKNRGLCKA